MIKLLPLFENNELTPEEKDYFSKDLEDRNNLLKKDSLKKYNNKEYTSYKQEFNYKKLENQLPGLENETLPTESDIRLINKDPFNIAKIINLSDVLIKYAFDKNPKILSAINSKDIGIRLLDYILSKDIWNFKLINNPEKWQINYVATHVKDYKDVIKPENLTMLNKINHIINQPPKIFF